MPGNGWIKLYRKTQNSDMYKNLNSVQRDVMINCLLLANHETSKWDWQGEIFECEPGQFITSLSNLKEVCAKDVSTQNIRTALKKLKKWNFLTNKSTKRGRLITIVNWEKYQAADTETNKATNKEVTKNQQSTNKALTTNKNYKNYKNLKNEKKKDNNIVPSAEIEKIYNSINGRWTGLFEDYIDVYRSKNKTNQITDNKHYRLLNELYQILQDLKFDFDKQEYDLTADVFEEGVNKTIEAGAANINYAKKVWISLLEKKEKNNNRRSNNNPRRHVKVVN
jgi:hypothetical protein